MNQDVVFGTFLNLKPSGGISIECGFDGFHKRRQSISVGWMVHKHVAPSFISHVCRQTCRHTDVETDTDMQTHRH